MRVMALRPEHHHLPPLWEQDIQVDSNDGPSPAEVVQLAARVLMGILRGELSFKEAIAKLLPHQRDFIGTACRNAALVGGQGSGKSVALCIAAILHASSEPNGFS